MDASRVDSASGSTDHSVSTTPFRKNTNRRRRTSISQPFLPSDSAAGLGLILEDGSPADLSQDDPFADPSEHRPTDAESLRLPQVKSTRTTALTRLDITLKALPDLPEGEATEQSSEPVQREQAKGLESSHAISRFIPGAKSLGESSNERPPRRQIGYSQSVHRAMPINPSNPSASSILDRLKSLRTPHLGSNSRYRKLDDDSADIALRPMPSVRSQSGSPVEAGIDISSFEGLEPFAPARTSRPSPQGSKDARLEAQGHLTGGLGSGMDEVVETTLARDGTVHHRSRPKRQSALNHKSLHIAGPGRANPKVAQEAAAKIGQIIVVEESVEAFDISNVDGHAVMKESGTDLEDAGSHNMQSQSYYFPPDPQMPDWRPFSMRKWWMLLLTSVAIVLFGVQEYLCQYSLSRGPDEGLFKFYNANELSTSEFFAWKYLPTMLLVTYGVMWQTTDFEVRRLEPYYQLSKPSGAFAQESLCVDYLTFWSYFVPWKALRYKQWAVLFSSLATIMASSMLAVLQNLSINMSEAKGNQSGNGAIAKVVSIDPVWSRMMEAVLLLIAVAGVALLFQLRRKSGLLSDPKGIAGIAAMANRSHILTDFKDLDVAPAKMIHAQLRHRRYILHKSSLWQGEYIRAGSASEDRTSVEAPDPHPVILRLGAGMSFLAAIVLCFILLPIMLNTPAQVALTHATWLPTAIATLLKMGWTNLETGLRIIEPFYILSRRHAPPSTLTLDYTGTVPGWLPMKAALNRHWLISFVGLGSILCEVLTVCSSSYGIGSDHGGETDHSQYAGFYLSMIILASLAIIASFVYLRRRHAFLPRQPGTIAGVLAFIHQSKMLYDFVSSEKQEEQGTRIEEMNSGAMRRHLESVGKSYGLGWYRGRDGVDHLGVDEEELLAGYKHGEDWRRGRLGKEDWSGTWDVY